MSAEPAPARPGIRPHWIVWLLALVGLLGIVALLFIAAAIVGIDGPRQPAKVAGDTPDTSFTVRDAHPLAGTNFIRIEIAAGSGRSGAGSYSGGADDLRNILLLDRASGAVRRLLPDNGRRIAQSFFLPAVADFAPAGDGYRTSDSEEEAPAPPAYFALLVAQPQRSDRFDLMIGALAGDEPRLYVMANLEGVDSVWMDSPTRIGLIVREQLNLYYRIVDIPSRRLVASRRIAI
jgi:hypothetical protein